MSSQVSIHATAGAQIVSNPSILGGKAVFAGTRVPVATLFGYMADNPSPDCFLESFPTVSREQAVAVLRYGQERIEREFAE